MQYCYICCALPQRSRLSIDRLSSVPPPPACLPSFMSRCNLFFGPAALTAAFPDAASRPALRADTEMRKDQGHLPVMNPRPHLALSFAHRRRLLFIFRLLYHALVGLPNWPDLRPCHTLLHANAHPGPTSDRAIVADLSASSSPRLLLHELQVPTLQLQDHANYPWANGATPPVRARELHPLLHSCPLRLPSDSLNPVFLCHLACSCDVPAMCSDASNMMRVGAIRFCATVACVRSAQPCASPSSLSTQSFHDRQSGRVWSRDTTPLIGSLAMSRRDLQLYSFLVPVPMHLGADRCRRPRAVARFCCMFC